MGWTIFKSDSPQTFQTSVGFYTIFLVRISARLLNFQVAVITVDQNLPVRPLILDLDETLPPILHYASPAPALTKFDMTRVIANHLSLPIDHVVPDSSRPVLKPGQTERPENTQLSVAALKELGIDAREDASFDEWWGKYIAETK